jgi:adenosylcobinamide-GDP ribazoletransferase
VVAVSAVSFLTQLPLGRFAIHDRDSVGAGAPLFPLVGAAISLGAGIVANAGADLLGEPLLAASLTVAFLAVVTGALHLDALADTADALGGWSREDRLRIMRDHTIGSFGATALGLALVVEVAAIGALIEHDAGLALFAAVGAASRAVSPLLAAALPYARSAEAQTSVTAGFTPRRGVTAVAAAAVLCAIAGIAGLVVLASALLVAAAIGLFCHRWIGGVTGDTLGAATQLAEVAGFVVAVALT